MSTAPPPAPPRATPRVRPAPPPAERIADGGGAGFAVENLFPRIRRFTPDECHKMLEIGILREGERVELLDGWLVCKMSQNSPHASSITALERLFNRRLPDDWMVRMQLPLQLAGSTPEPDAAVVRFDPFFYRAGHPGPGVVGLVVEVSDSTLAEDREFKGRLYSEAGIGEYWVVNVAGDQVEVYSQPGPGDAGYGARTNFARGTGVPLTLGGRHVTTINVSDIIVFLPNDVPPSEAP